MNKTIKIFALGYAIIMASSVNAATIGTSFQSKLLVNATCTLNSNGLDFLTTGLLTTNIDATSTVTFICTNTTPYTLSIGNGLYGTSSLTRKLKILPANTEAVGYSVYKDAARSQIWGSTGAEIYSNVGTGAIQTLTVYGRVPAQTAVTPGTYTDSLVVTISY